MRGCLTLCLLLLVSLTWGCGADEEARLRREAESNALLTELSQRASAHVVRDAGPAPTPPSASVRGVVVYRGEGDPSAVSRVRAVIELAGDAPVRRRERAATAGQARAVLFELEGARVEPRVLPVTDVGAGGLSRVLVDADAEGASVYLELTPDARYGLYALEDPKRLVIDVERPLARTPSAEKKLVLLDPGHGGEDLGSPGPFGLWEGKLTLDISRRVRAWLAQLAPDVRVRMTRDSDVYITLEERAAMANSLGADLFVSVHLNAATTTVEKGGVATYVLDVNNDRNVLRLAARENGTATTNVSPLQFLVGSLARNEQLSGSERLASLIQRGTLFSARRYLPTLTDRGVKSAMFYVLVGAQMPAVLVEGSFITQPDEAEQLRTAPYRDAIAEGIARGIAKYLAEN